MTVDAATGDLLVATYVDWGHGDNNRVYRFRAAQIESALLGDALTLAEGEFLFHFQGAGSLAVDGAGRVWAAGWEIDGQIQGYDPATGASAFFSPQHPPLSDPYSTAYSLKTFTHGGRDYLAAIARDPYDLAPEVYYLTIDIARLVIPVTVIGWRTHCFGADAQNPSLETTLWGDLADPDGDGLPNLLEFAFGIDPLVADSELATPFAEVEGSHVAITFLRDRRKQELTYLVEASATLAPGSWQEIARSDSGGETQSSNASGASIEETDSPDLVTVRVEDTRTLFATEGRIFLRVRVVR